MTVRFKMLNEQASAPHRAHTTDAGYDLTATSITVDPQGNIVYGTGIAVEIPAGYMGLVFPRSSVCKYALSLTNCVGVIDSGYRGEVMMKFRSTAAPLNHRIGDPARYKVGDRVGQLVILPVPAVEFVQVDELNDSDRGASGYGSTGE